MASLAAVPVSCPCCSATIRVPVSSGPAEMTANGHLVARLMADDAPIRAHLEQHRNGSGVPA